MKVGASITATTTFKQSVCRLTIRRIDRNNVIEKHNAFQNIINKRTFFRSKKPTGLLLAISMWMGGSLLVH